MTRQQLIEKWESKLSIWKDAMNDQSFKTNEELQNVALYVSAIDELLTDLESIKKEEGDDIVDMVK
jgi:hypothetical protein|nr:MAG TPA: hypothetical protein [Caudoviricetes sp.]